MSHVLRQGTGTSWNKPRLSHEYGVLLWSCRLSVVSGRHDDAKTRNDETKWQQQETVTAFSLLRVLFSHRINQKKKWRNGPFRTSYKSVCKAHCVIAQMRWRSVGVMRSYREHSSSNLEVLYCVINLVNVLKTSVVNMSPGVIFKNMDQCIFFDLERLSSVIDL